jgi:F-type H+-transporting ATPase subunit b
MTLFGRTAAMAAALVAAPAMASAAGGGGEVGNLGQAVAALLIFLLLLLVLGKWAWKPVIEALQRREQDMQTRIDQAKDRETKAEQLLAEYQQRIARAEDEADTIRDQAHRDAEAERDDLLKAAREQARQAIDDARREIEHAQTAALEDLQAATARMAAEIAERVLREELGPDAQQRLIQHAAREIVEAESSGSRT